MAPQITLTEYCAQPGMLEKLRTAIQRRGLPNVSRSCHIASGFVMPLAMCLELDQILGSGSLQETWNEITATAQLPPVQQLLATLVAEAAGETTLKPTRKEIDQVKGRIIDLWKAVEGSGIQGIACEEFGDVHKWWKALCDEDSRHWSTILPQVHWVSKCGEQEKRSLAQYGIVEVPAGCCDEPNRTVLGVHACVRS